MSILRDTELGRIRDGYEEVRPDPKNWVPRKMYDEECKKFDWAIEKLEEFDYDFDPAGNRAKGDK